MYFIDTHTHLYDKQFDEDIDEVIQKALQASVKKMLLPDIDSQERAKLFSLREKYPSILFPMLGLYPVSVKDNWEDELSLMYEYIDRDIVAIGEIGLDYYYSKENAGLQKKALIVQLELASKHNLPVNIHLRDASEDFVKVIKENKHLGIRGNLHAFSTSYETWKELQKYADFSVGIGGVVTFKNSRLGETVSKIPLDKILLETDSPYLTPHPYRGKRNDSSYIPIIAEKIADIKQISIEELAHITSNNAEKLFKL